LKGVFEVRRQDRNRTFGKTLQSAHRSHESVGEIVTADRDGAPAREIGATLGVLGCIWFSVGIIKVDTHRDACCPVESLPLNEAMLVIGAEVVIVIRGNEDALRVAIVEDGDGLSRGKIGRVRVFYGACIDTLRITEPRTNKIEVVNAVIEDFEPWGGGEKGPEMPRSVRAGLDFDVMDFTEETAAHECGHSEIIGRVAQRKVYGGSEVLLAAEVADGASLLEGLPHGLLDEQCCVLGKPREDVDKLRGGNCHIEDGVGGSEANATVAAPAF